MIDRIIEWCTKNKTFVYFGVLVFVVWSIWSIYNIPLDALPDLSDTQVIVYAKWDRPPQIIEDQVTYPIVTSLLGTPKVKDIRAFSDYGYSYVYIIFDDNTDVYWARSRVLEYLSKVTSDMPQGVKIELGPDASGIGWVYSYILYDESGNNSLADLRTFQDWHLKYELQSVKGVSEVASVGGFTRQYQIIVNPDALRAYNIPISTVISSVKSSNQEMGARLLDITGREYMVTIKGYLKDKKDIEEVILKNFDGTPVRVKDVAKVVLGPEIRRGVAEYNGIGETAGGIVIMRYNENALNVIKRVKEKLNDVKLPQGVKIISTYDRSDLIIKSVETLRKSLIQEMIVVALIIILFLWHFTSSLIPIITLPLAVLFSFIPLSYMRITSNIMSLGGIAIAIGDMVDAAIGVIENSHKRLSDWKISGKKGSYKYVLIDAIKEVGRPSFFSLLVISVSFIPIFTLENIEGRLFKPLAFTKNLSILFGAILTITLVPALVMTFIRMDKFKLKNGFLNGLVNKILVGTIHEENKHPVSKLLSRLYDPVIKFILKKPNLIIFGSLILLILTVPFYFLLGKEFIPPLNEGSILFMPTTFPGISITEATKLLQVQDRILKSFPEVESVFGKAGRAETSTDPAPFSMMETVIMLKSQKEWRKIDRWWYSKMIPEFLKGPFRLIWSDIISYEELINKMDYALKLPGVINAWTLPIKARIDMLTTGVRTPVGIKIYGDDLAEIEKLGKEIELKLKKVKGTRSVYAEKTAEGFFLIIDIKREEASRYGLNIEDVQMALAEAIGGENISNTFEGRKRFPINIRYPRDYRDDAEKIKNIYIPVNSLNASGNASSGGRSMSLMNTGGGSADKTAGSKWIPLSLIADVKLETGPGMIRDENGRLAGYVFIDVYGRDIGSYVNDAKSIIKNSVKFPAGYTYTFSGQYESMERVAKRMLIVLPLTLFIIMVLIYISTGSFIKTLIVLLALPFSMIGVIWILFILRFNLSLGVWSGIIALLGVGAQTGVLMLLYIDLSFEEMKKKGRMNTREDLINSIYIGAADRIRPRIMAFLTTAIGLIPIMTAQSYEIGADLMKRIAAPMVGGSVTSFLMGLIVYPPIYYIWKWNFEMKKNTKGGRK